MKKLRMFRVKGKNEDGKYKLLFKIYPSGLEFQYKKKTYFLEVDSLTINKLLDNLNKSGKFQVV